MKKLTSVCGLTVCGVMLMAGALHAQDDVETRALRDEMARSMKDLKLEGSDKPYFISYKITDTETKEAQASLGALTSSNESRSRSLTVVVRVGDYDFDSSNFMSNDFTALIGSIGAGVMIPLDDNYEELRRRIWLATDIAYKKAIEDLSGKKAALANKNRTETIADFSKEPARQEQDLMPPIEEKLSDAEALVKAASAVIRDLPGVETSEARLEVVNSTEHFLNSEGTSYVRQLPEISFHETASLQVDDGEVLSDWVTKQSRSVKAFPSQDALVDETRKMVERLTTTEKARKAKRYNGPILFEGQAAAELFARTFADQLTASPKSVSGGQSRLAGLLMGSSGSNDGFLNRRGSRVLPDFLSVEDNPLATEAEGKTLLGSYKFDEEGTPAQETLLVKDGILKTLLTGRAPVRDIPKSSGNMRERGVQPGNVLVSSTKSEPLADLSKQMMDLVKTRGLDYGVVVRRMNARQAVACFRVYPDGHEEQVRNGRIAEITSNTFKEILAVSNERYVYTDRPGSGGLLGAMGGHGDLVSYVVPSMLFEDATLEHTTTETSKPPVVESPLAK